MKQIWRVALVASVFLAGCVSTSTFDQKQAELESCQKQAKTDLDACQNARSDAENKLALANQELGVYRQAAEARKAQLDKMQQQEADLRGRLSKELADKNVEIEQLRGQLSVRMLDKIVFRSGSAEILPSGMEVLNKLADALKDNTDTIRVEGHTDDTPISAKLQAKYPSNWELSAARAAGVARYFETKGGIDPKRLEAVGFSMYQPVAPNDSPANKQRNRRVEIVLKPAAEPESAPAAPTASLPAEPQSAPAESAAKP